MHCFAVNGEGGGSRFNRLDDVVGVETIATWLNAISTVVAPMHLANFATERRSLRG